MKLRERIREVQEARKIEKTTRRRCVKDAKDIQRRVELKLWRKLDELPEGSDEAERLINQLTKISTVRKDDRPSADNIVGAVTSLTGLGGAIAYDQRHNLPKAAGAFVRRPGREPRNK